MSKFATGIFNMMDKKLEKSMKKMGLEETIFHMDEDTQMHYWHGGQGHPLLLLHGFGATTKYQWNKQIPGLIKIHRLIVPNLIFFGKSTSKKRDFSLDFQARCVLKLLDKLYVDTFKIMGLSYGGGVAAQLAHLVPDRLDKLVLCDSPVKFYTIEDRNRALEIFGIGDIQDLVIPKHAEGIRHLIKLAFYRPPWIPNFMIESIYNGLYDNHIYEKNQLIEHLETDRDYYWELDYPVRCNVLLVWGAHDQLIPPRVGEQLNRYFGYKSKFVLIPRTAHVPNIERPRYFNRIVSDFLLND